MNESRRAEALISTVIAGRFRLRRLLGSGGMGAVYEAIDEWTERRVALKRVRRHEDDPRADERFFREARAVARLDHPHVVRLFDLGRDEDGSLFLVQELIEGRDLRHTLRDKGRLSERETIELMFAAADAIAHAHEQGVVHRDLKPENIFVQRARSGRLVAKLIDFGIARTPSRDGQLTPTGQVFGTPSYMAPEQADGQSEVAPSWDLWALGVIAFECLTGRNPYARDNVLATLSAVLKDRAPSVASEREGLSPALCAVVDRALLRERDERYPDAFALRDALFATGLLDGDPWAKTLLDRPKDADERLSHERLASDGAMATAPMPMNARTEATLAPEQPSAPTSRAPSSADTLDTAEAAIALDRGRESEPEALASLGITPRPRRARSAFAAVVVGAAIALTLVVNRARDHQTPSPAAPTTAPSRTATALPTVTAAPIATPAASVAPAVLPANPLTVRAQSAAAPRVERSPEPRPRAARAEGARAVPAANAAPIVHTEPQTERAPAAAPPTTPADDETSTPIRRYP